MVGYAFVLSAAAPVFGALILGALLRRTGLLRREADASLTRMVFNIFYPALVFDHVAGNPSLQSGGRIALIPLLGFALVAGGFALGYGASRLAGLKTRPQRGSFALTTGIYNYGFIPIPLIMALFRDSEGALGVLFVLTLGVEVAIWTVGVMMLSGATLRESLRKVFNAPLVSIVGSMALNLSGLNHAIPDWVGRFAELLGGCSIPLGLMLAGAALSDALGEVRWLGAWRPVVIACALRLALIPAVFLLLARFAAGSTELRQVLVVAAAMPSGLFPAVIARHYGGDAPTALLVIVSTNLVGIITMPLWITLGLPFAGLS